MEEENGLIEFSDTNVELGGYLHASTMPSAIFFPTNVEIRADNIFFEGDVDVQGSLKVAGALDILGIRIEDGKIFIDDIETNDAWKIGHKILNYVAKQRDEELYINRIDEI